MFILLNTWDEVVVVTDDDGYTIYFANKDDAENYGKENLQKFKIVEL